MEHESKNNDNKRAWYKRLTIDRYKALYDDMKDIATDWYTKERQVGSTPGHTKSIKSIQEGTLQRVADGYERSLKNTQQQRDRSAARRSRDTERSIARSIIGLSDGAKEILDDIYKSSLGTAIGGLPTYLIVKSVTQDTKKSLLASMLGAGVGGLVGHYIHKKTYNT